MYSKSVSYNYPALVENLLVLGHKYLSDFYFYRRNYTCNSVVIVFEYARACYISCLSQHFSKLSLKQLEITHWLRVHGFDAFYPYEVLREVKKFVLNHDDKMFL